MTQIRNTNQRKMVLDAVRSRHDHPCADDIYADVRIVDPRISRGTVYRNLRLLAELGEIKFISIPNGAGRFDFRTDNHYHFCCERCGRVMDVELEYQSNLNDMVKLPKGARISGHRIIFNGVCAECSK